MNSGIYKITNTVTGMFYIGRTVNWRRRQNEHRNTLVKGCHHNSRMQNSWNVHGESAFTFELIWEEVAEFQPELEQLFLDEFISSGIMFNAHNLSEGGSCGMKFPNSKKSIESKAKLFAALDWAVATSSTRDAALTEFKCSWDSLKKYQPEWEAINGPLLLPKRASGEKSGMYKHGKSKEMQTKRTVEQLKELNESRSENMKGDKNPMYGKTHTEEARLLISEAATQQAASRKLLKEQQELK